MPKARPNLTARVVALTSTEAADPRMGGTVTQRVAAVAELTAHAWKLARRPLPEYSRMNMPVVVTSLASQT